MAGNSNSGRRPRPTAVNDLMGNPSKTKRPPEPQPPTGPVNPPASLSPQAKDVWTQVAPVCEHMGTLTTADVDTFAAYCELQATLNQIVQFKARPDWTPVITNRHGEPVEHPAVRMERQTALALKVYQEKFGLDASSRARLAVPQTTQTANDPAAKWDGLLQQAV